MLNTLVRKLIEQLMKFGIVGVIAFVIDWGILNLLVGCHRLFHHLADFQLSGEHEIRIQAS